MLRWLGGDDFYFRWPPSRTVFVFCCSEKKGGKLKSRRRWQKNELLADDTKLIYHQAFWDMVSFTNTPNGPKKVSRNVSVDISSLINSFWYIFTDGYDNCSQNKLHWPEGCCLSKYVLNNSDGTLFPRELLMVPAALYYGHIHVGVCGGEQVGEALPCPCSNLLDLDQWRLERGIVPYPSQVTPYPDLIYGIQMSQGQNPGDCGLSQGCYTSSCCVSELMPLWVSLCGQDKTRPVWCVILFLPFGSTGVKQGIKVSMEAFAHGYRDGQKKLRGG